MNYWFFHNNFIYEAKYVDWLSNVVLGMKASGKWRLCVEYIDLNKACCMDSYPLTCIHELVDNWVRYRLLPFMDAYSGIIRYPCTIQTEGIPLSWPNMQTIPKQRNALWFEEWGNNMSKDDEQDFQGRNKWNIRGVHKWNDCQV